MKEQYLLGVLALFLFIWNITLVSVDSQNGVVMRGHTATNVIEQYANIQSVDADKIVLYKFEGHMKRPNTDILLSGGRWLLKARPVIGDHIHAAISFYIDGKPLPSVLHDRNPTETIPYEKKPSICKVEGDVAYTKMWPHCGVHTHCDGLVHIHPWSAPASIRKEGLDVQLQLWFDQTGIEYHEDPLISLKFPDGRRFDSNDTYRWYAAEKKCFKDKKSTIYDQNINQIWLGHAYASYVIWYGKIGSEEPLQVKSHIELLSKVSAKGYNGENYPQTCV